MGSCVSANLANHQRPRSLTGGQYRDRVIHSHLIDRAIPTLFGLQYSSALSSTSSVNLSGSSSVPFHQQFEGFCRLNSKRSSKRPKAVPYHRHSPCANQLSVSAFSSSQGPYRKRNTNSKETPTDVHLERYPSNKHSQLSNSIALDQVRRFESKKIAFGDKRVVGDDRNNNDLFLPSPSCVHGHPSCCSSTDLAISHTTDEHLLAAGFRCGNDNLSIFAYAIRNYRRTDDDKDKGGQIADTSLQNKLIDLQIGDRLMLLNKLVKNDWLFVRNLRTLDEGYALSTHLSITSNTSKSSEIWYHRSVTRKEAEKMLMQQLVPLGAYLVRNCETSPAQGTYSLSVKDYGGVKTGKGQSCCVKHYKLRSNGNGKFFIDSRNLFNSIPLLLEHYQVNSDGLCCKLTVPCPALNASYPETAQSMLTESSVGGSMQVPPSSAVTNQFTGDNKLWNIPRESVRFIRKLGHGMFGEVWQGRLIGSSGEMVAIKTLKMGSMSTSAFLEEANIMKRLNHPRLVRLLAVCIDEGDPLFIVTEYMVNGSLLEVLRHSTCRQTNEPTERLRNHHLTPSMNHFCFSKSSDNNKLGVDNLIDFACQIASGMMYLEHNRYIHRDLAARNVLVDQMYSVKIADFGLARFIEEDEYTAHAGARFPIKWTAPEAARYGRFTIKSDVWSFGVLLTELMTYGQPPYPGMSTSDVLDNVQRGYRMPKPEVCPEMVYDIMLKCWDAYPDRRPSFDVLYMFFNDFAMLRSESIIQGNN